MDNDSNLMVFLVSSRGTVFWSVTVFCGLVTALIFLINQRARRKIDQALIVASGGKEQIAVFGLCRTPQPKGPADRALAVPERLWCYGKVYLENFIEVASERHVLDFYAKPTLVWRDSAFAVALALFTALVAIGIAPLLPFQPYASGVMLGLACMGLIYGVADVAEDQKLVMIFAKRTPVDADDAASANALTRVKLCALTASVIGAVTFLLLNACNSLLERISSSTGRDTKPVLRR